jgi:cytochrome o ubiquinol oxidase subunit 2
MAPFGAPGPISCTSTDETWCRVRCAAIHLAVIASASALSGCQSGILDPQGPVGAANRTILLNALAIMLAIVVPTILATLAFAWWFRASNARARYLPDWAYSGRIELVVWSIPTVVILFLGGVIWIGSHDLDPARPLNSNLKPVNVQAVSLDWKWLFIYPDEGVASVNELVVPAGTPLHFRLTSGSVMNAFFVPQLGSMIYMMHGMTTQLYLQADRQGDFYGRSSMFSGDGFSGMQFTLRAVSDDAFANWIRTAQNAGPALDTNSYMVLAKQSIDVPPATYRLADPNLFHLIATQAVPPAPGPTTGRPTRDVSHRTGG